MNKLLLLQTALVLSLLPAMALAQYKVVRPDGSITYTDRPPAEAGNLRITPMGRLAQATPPPAESGLPLELRTAAQRWPVTLYTAADCAPCEAGRRLLVARGIPFSERRVASDEDAQALERLVGGRTLPALTVGAQQLRGFSEGDWSGYLDAAGYPRESRLPRNWPQPAATPLVERVAVPATGSRSAPAAPTAPLNTEIQIPVLPSSSVRF